jgi:hypothetical protein
MLVSFCASAVASTVGVVTGATGSQMLQHLVRDGTDVPGP